MKTVQALLEAIDGLDVVRDEPMARHTTFRVGGPARLFATVRTREALGRALDTLLRERVPYLVLGNGSNVVFADRGFRGAVLKLDGLAGAVVTRDALSPGVHRLEADAGLSVTRVLRLVKDKHLAGLEFLGGIPGTVGGIVRMNAGTSLGQASDALEAAELYVPTQGLRWFPATDLGLAYRYSYIPTGAVVTAARFAVIDEDPGMRDRLAEVIAYRKETQPLTQPSAGSVFTNPPGDSAGRLLDEAGMKGVREGGAEVSPLHANWIVNAGGATAQDIVALMRRCVGAVEAKFGVTLQPELRLLGDWDDDA